MVTPTREATYWEEHCNKHLAKVGIFPIPDWRSTFWHPKLKLLLMVYVDDFKMYGPQENLSTVWQLICQGIKTDEAEPVSKCLGCEHIIRDTIVNGKPVREM
eukprot:1310476-Heterocapsa_arctica.AAC.1